MKTKISFLLTILVLSLSCSLTSCRDNDLDANGGNSSDTELDEAKAQKYDALSVLLAAVADVDSLPTNWEDKNFTVAPTIGVVKDEANPHVRYVQTSSLEEADRIYRSLLSKDVTTTVENDSWQMDGIGSMTFEVNNQADLFATLKVNVQQLPTLEEIRFVPVSALGENGLIKPAGTYYSLGDVICQMVQNADGKVLPTFYVCVRPCSMSERLRKTHWCTFQLVDYAQGCTNSNYLATTNQSILPENLCNKQSDGERFIQNYFNVLRLMAKPELAQDASYQGIGEITLPHFNYDSVRTVSYMWDYLSLWDKKINRTDGVYSGVINNNYNGKDAFQNDYWDDNSSDGSDAGNEEDGNSQGSTSQRGEIGPLEALNTYLGEKSPIVNIYYYGNKKASFFSKGDYNVYNLRLSVNNTAKKNASLFNEAKKQTFYIYDNNNQLDFRDYEKAYTDYTYPGGGSTENLQYQFIVKYKTGGELEGLSNSSNDVAPNTSFQKRQAQNRIWDVLVYRNHVYEPAFKTEYGVLKPNNNTSIKNESSVSGNIEETIDEALFAFGDEVTQTKRDMDGKENPLQGKLFCIKPASDNYYLTVEVPQYDARGAYFVGANPLKDKNKEDVYSTVNPNISIKKCILFELLNSYIAERDCGISLSQMNLIQKTLDELEAKSGNTLDIYKEALKHLHDNITLFCSDVKNDDEKITITCRFNKEEKFYQLTYYKEKDKYEFETTDYYSVRINPIYTYRYVDKYRFYDEFSTSRTFYTKRRRERLGMKLFPSKLDHNFYTYGNNK